MSYLPLTLSVRQKPDASGDIPEARMPSKSEIADAMQRDGFSCRCCGFTSRKYQRVVPYNADKSAKGADPFITVCTSCERCLALEQTGLIGGGTLIWLPELSQTDLNHVVRALYVARSSNDETLATAANRTLDVLMARKSEAKKRLGTDDPLVLATALQEIIDEDSYTARAQRLEGIRLLAADRYLVRQRDGDVDMFPAMLAYWTSAEGPFSDTPVKDWAKRFTQLAELN